MFLHYPQGVSLWSVNEQWLIGFVKVIASAEQLSGLKLHLFDPAEIEHTTKLLVL